MGALALVTAPAKEPVRIEELRRHLRIDTADHDAALATYLRAARQHCENVTRRAFITQTWDYRTHCWEDPLWLPIQPVQSITSVTYIAESGASTALATSQYTLKGAYGDGYAFIEPAYEVTWPTLRDVSYPVTVRFVAGYGLADSTVPEPIRQAIMLHVEMLFDRNIQGRSLLESARDALLDPYRVVRV